MKLGTFMMPLHPVARSYPDILREDRAAILLADRLGYAEAFVGEHVTDAAEPITSCLMFLASLAHETSQIVLGSGTLNLPNTHPATIAAQVAMLDNMLEGRFIMGISQGGLMSDVEVFGNLEKDRTAMFVEAIDMVLKIWEREPPYNLFGKYFQVTTQRTMIPDIGQGKIKVPFQGRKPLIVGTAVAPFSKGVTALAARGWQTISANFLLPQWVATHWPKYVEGRASVGAVADPADWRVAKSIFVADSAKTANEYGLGETGPYQFYFSQLIRKLVGSGGRSNLFKASDDISDSDITPAYAAGKLVIAGTVDSVVEQLLEFRHQIGDFGTLLYACHDWVDPELAQRSMQLMAEQVMPRINAALGKSTETEIIPVHA
jgi:alkanesulfonate monooxygenase SsuD/methylene tetrahydromethanopterin reductase-like flavin-dependent oxidoreductase (luciferase family)